MTETRRRLSEAGYRARARSRARSPGCVELGLLDDEAFARHWVESRDRARPRGEIALKRELRLRGVESQVIAAAIDERRSAEADDPFGAMGDAGDGAQRRDPDEAAAAKLLERRRRDLERVADPRKRRARAYALLARNGFGPEVASRLSAGFMTATTDDPPED